MSALRSMALPAALLAATGGVALATWRYLSARRQQGEAVRVEEEGNVQLVSAHYGEDPDTSIIGEEHEGAKDVFTAVSPVLNKEDNTGPQGSNKHAPPGTSPVCQEEKGAAPVTSKTTEEKKIAAAPVTPITAEEKKNAPAPVTPVTAEEKKRAAAPVTSLTAEEKKSAAAPVTSILLEEKSANPKSAAPQETFHRFESSAQEKCNTSPIQTTEDTPKSPRSVDPCVDKSVSDTVTSAEILHKEKHAACKQVLVLGLDGSGKTSILNSIAANKGRLITTPTEGVNAICISNGNSKMEFLEIGGSEQLRPYWKMYLSRAFAVIFVVDSADHGRLPLAKRHLHQLIQLDSVLPLIVLANKQDLQDAYQIPEIHDALALSEICENRKLFLIGTYVTKDGSEISSGIQDAKEFLAQLLLENSAEIK